MLFRVLRDEGGAGGTGNPGATKSPGASPEGGKTPEGGQKPVSQPAVPKPGDTSQIDYEKFYSENKDRLAKVDTIEAELAHVKKKMGQQAQVVGAYNKLNEYMKSNPQRFIKEMAAEAGLQLSINGNDAPPKFDDNFDPNQASNNLLAMENRIIGRMKAELAPQIQTLFEEDMRKKYPDYEDMDDSRELLKTNLLSKRMTYNELLHLAAQGLNMADALTAAKESGKTELRAELEKKAKGALEPGGPSLEPGAETKPHDPTSKDYFNHVINRMKKVRG